MAIDEKLGVPDLLVTRVDPPDEEAASVTLTSEAGELVAFCFPCGLVAGSRVPNRLSPLDVPVLQSAYLDDWPQETRAVSGGDRLQRDGHYGYSGTGQVIDAERGWVLVHGFVIDFGDVPAGARIGQPRRRRSRNQVVRRYAAAAHLLRGM
ncbi:hypothetical protein ACQ86G_19615 [Roseateles chitinivorans]|uniref:hypothetical protein n=1 Tax=Roseateles chitinivorans TaxID=2917965 RepID=UPI003D666842